MRSATIALVLVCMLAAATLTFAQTTTGEPIPEMVEATTTTAAPAAVGGAVEVTTTPAPTTTTTAEPTTTTMPPCTVICPDGACVHESSQCPCANVATLEVG